MASSGWWDWLAPGEVSEESTPQMSDNEMRVALETLAERCFILDNMSPKVTLQTIRGALGQFGTVVKVKMLTNPSDMKFAGAAIVEMIDRCQRDQVVKQLKEYLFMVGAIPRPARAIAATPLLLFDHPWRRNPNKIKPELVRRDDPRAKYLGDRDYIDRVKIDDDGLLLRLMEQEEIKLSQAQESICKEAMEKLFLIGIEKQAGTINEIGKLHGLF